MHVSSLAKMDSFLRVYAKEFPKGHDRTRLLEIGSKSYEGQPTYRKLIDDKSIQYTGLDLEEGLNVDLVPASGYVWPEITDESFDVCISGQTFEHNPFFWVTMAEISRVLVPGGFVCIIAPASQAVHRYPLDCWRFYPDSWAALCSLTGLDPIEIYVETDQMALNVIDGHIRDSMLIARRPLHRTQAIKDRLKLITEPLKERIDVKPMHAAEGIAVADYRKTAPRTRNWRVKLAHLIAPHAPSTVLPEKP